MKIYGSLQSTNTIHTLVTAAHLGVPYELVKLDLANKDDRANLAQINPNNKVPVMTEGDWVLTESNAIDEYLCDITPGQTLLPTDPKQKAEVNRWRFWITAHFSQACGGLNFERMIKKFLNLGAPDEVHVARNEALFHQFAKVADAHLRQHPWLANDQLSLADISLVSYLEHAERAAYPLASYTSILDLRGHVRALPAWKKVLS
ncbi:MAG: glutathione S-transferase family protein [Kofleriaceae bacterium]